MVDYITLQRVILKESHGLTVNTRHFRDGQLLSAPHDLRIVKYEDDPNYFLLHFDKDGKEMTDTCHDSLEEALAQAEYEFQIKPSEWNIMTQ